MAGTYTEQNPFEALPTELQEATLREVKLNAAQANVQNATPTVGAES